MISEKKQDKNKMDKRRDRCTMSQANAQEIQPEIIVRMITPEDFDAVAELSLKCFGPDNSLKQEHFKSQFTLFPEGQICLEYNGKIVGTALSLIVNFEDYGYDHNYYDICDLGFIRNHNPEGRHLYGIEVAVDADYRGMQLGKRLYEGRRAIARKFNLEKIYIGGRMPDYYKHAEQFSALDYAKEVAKGEIYDPVLTFQMKNGFTLNDVIAKYLPGDEESLEYAALMEWVNPDYSK